MSVLTLPDLASTVAQVDAEWVRIARPLIKAYLAMDDVEAGLISARHDFRGRKHWNAPAAYDENVAQDAVDIVRKAVAPLHAAITDVREKCLSDVYQHGPRLPEPADPAARTAWDQAEDEAEEFNEAVRRGVIEVEKAIDREAGE